MAPEVSGEDITGEGGGKFEAGPYGLCKPPAAFPAPTADAALKVPEPCEGRQRNRSVPSPEAPARRSHSHREARDGEEQLRLLWALWESQQGLLREEELIREAAAAHAEIAARSDALQREVLDAEAELQERRREVPAPRRGLTRRAESGSAGSLEDLAAPRASDDEDLDSELEELRAQNEALQRSLREAPCGRRPSTPEVAPRRSSASRELESLEAELLRLCRAEERRAEEHRGRVDDLQDQIREAEARGREACAGLRERLAEVFVETEVLEAELQGAVRGRELHLQRLQGEEQALQSEVQSAAEELQALEEARSDAAERLACSVGDDCSSLGDDQSSQVSAALSSEALAALTPKVSVSIWEELHPGDCGANGQSAWDSLPLQSERGSRLSVTPRHRRAPSFLAYRCSQAVRPRSHGENAGEATPELEGTPVQFLGPAGHLDGIGEEGAAEEPPAQPSFPWERVRAKLGQQKPKLLGGPCAPSSVPRLRLPAGGACVEEDARAETQPAAAEEASRPPREVVRVGGCAEGARSEPQPVAAEEPSHLLREARRISSRSGSSGAVDASAEPGKARAVPSRASGGLGPQPCRGVLEWTVREAETAPGSPRWAGPCLFEVAEDASGRRVLRALSLGLGAAEAPAKDLAIPLRSMAAVREDRQDALGLAFLVRYKTGGERVEILFRAATREARGAWVQGLCDAIRDSRRGSAGDVVPPPTKGV